MVKDIETGTAGSNLSGMRKVGNTVFFFAGNTKKVWKTDGTEAGTVVVSTQAIDIHDISYGVPNFHVFNNELYYYVQKSKTVYYQPLELWKTDGTKLYQQLPQQLHGTLQEVEPLREVPENYKAMNYDYKTWNETK